MLVLRMQPSVTSLIARLRGGDRTALDQLIPMVYTELHNVAAGYLNGERQSHTLQATALVHETYLRLLRADHPEYKDRAHFFGVAASVMRQILVDHARSRHAAKRGGPGLTLVIDENLDAGTPRESTVVALDDALRSLAKVDEDKARLVELRFFGGMTAEEIAEFLPESVHRVRREMRLALAWLHREVSR
jgi:RNA polymerase sigma-70 factor (ECF subfamily)